VERRGERRERRRVKEGLEMWKKWDHRGSWWVEAERKRWNQHCSGPSGGWGGRDRVGEEEERREERERREEERRDSRVRVWEGRRRRSWRRRKEWAAEVALEMRVKRCFCF
jgi:hypothetical protein